MRIVREYLDAKKAEHESAAARHVDRERPTRWRVKLRVRLQSRLISDALEIKTRFRGRRVVIRSRNKGKLLSQSDWIIFVARRFSSVEAAAEFGLSLQCAVSAIAALRCIPIDVGADNVATTATSDVVKAALAKQGSWLIDDIHGVDVYPDLPTVLVLGSEASLTTTMSPHVLIDPLEQIGPQLSKLDERGRDASLLLNAAYIAQHPVAMVTLGVAAVELLAAGERWNSAQLGWIEGLKDHLADSHGLEDIDRAELVHGINGFRTMGVLARTRRLLESLDLGALRPRWERLYKKRSRLFHGEKRVSYAELVKMSSDARLLCQTVVEGYIRRQVGIPGDEAIGS